MTTRPAHAGAVPGVRLGLCGHGEQCHADLFPPRTRRPRSSTPIRRSRASGGKSCTASARRGFVWDAALLVLVAVLTALLLADTPILNLLTTSAVPLILFGLYQLCSLPAAWAEVQDLSRLVRRLEAGEPMDHRAPIPGGGSSPCCPSHYVFF